MQQKQLAKKYLIAAIIGALTASALTGIIIILKGSFGLVESRILASTLVAGFLSIAGLASLRHIESEHKAYRLFSLFSLGVCLVALVITLGAIWGVAFVEDWRIIASALILSFSLGHASLLLPASSALNAANLVAGATVLCVFLVAGALIYLISSDSMFEGYSYRLLAVLAILDVLGTVVTPIVNRATRSNDSSRQ